MRRWSALLCAVLALASVITAGAARAAPPLAAYGKLPAVENVVLSPSGERFAMIQQRPEGRLVIVRKADGSPMLAAPIGDTKIRSLEWAGEDHLLIFGSNTIENAFIGLKQREAIGLIHVDVNTGKTYTLFKRSKVFLDSVFDWSGSARIDGRWYGFVGAITYAKMLHPDGATGIWPDLYRVDLETGEAKVVSETGTGDRNWLIAPDGSIVAHSRYDARGRTFNLYAGATAGQPLVHRAAEAGNFTLAGAGRTPGTVLFAERTGDDFLVHEIPLAGGGDGAVISKGENAGGSIFDRDSGLLIGRYTSDEAGEVLYDKALRSRLNAARGAFADVRASLVDFSRNFDVMVLRTEGAKDAGTYWLIDIVNRKAVPIGNARPDVKPEDIGPMRMYAYKAADGLAMDGVLTLPPGREAKNLPLVVMPHGGPLAPGDKVNFDWWAQAFASRGYAVFQPNYRGTLGYGEAFRKAAFGEYGKKMQTDISDGVTALAKEGIVDPKRACIVGASYGGYAALAGVTLQQGLYKCAVSVSGPAEMSRFIFWLRDRAGSDQSSVRFWRDLSGETSSELDAISPMEHADRADAPVLLIHGKDDTVVPFEQSDMMAKALRRAGKSVELIALEGEDHWESRAITRQKMVEASVAFVQKHNPAD